MNTIKYKKYTFQKYILNRDIVERCKIIAESINAEYSKEEVVFIGLLEGCFPFISCVLNFLNCKYTSSFLRISSYKGFKSEEINFGGD